MSAAKGSYNSSMPVKKKNIKRKLSPPALLRKTKRAGWKSRPIGKKTRTKSHFKKTRKNQTNSLRNFSIFFGFFILLISVLVIGAFAWLTYTLPDPEELLQRNIAQSTKIYDRTGKTVLYEIFAEERRSLVELEDIPQNLINATLMAEDQDFFTHPGFDLKGIFRAIIVDVLQGGKVQGASTLTQQFIKNAFLTTEKTWQRKIKELLLAYRLEKKYSKHEILQMYFNEIPYGSNAYGAEAASQIYFGKSVKDLGLDECTLLAAMAKAPTYYSPRGNHQDELIFRRNYLLDVMTDKGHISQELASQTKKINTLEKIIPHYENITAPHFIMYVKGLLTEKYGQRSVEQGGLRVITTLDIDKQEIAEKAIENQVKRNEEIFKATNAALVSIDVKTGQILAMVGSKDFFNEEIDGQVNVSTRLRQPGSSFKPVVYAAAFEKGYTPDTILFDVETSFGPTGINDEEYIPQNYNEEFYGPVTIRQALSGSLNVSGVKTLYLTGVNNALNLAQRMGYTTLVDKSRYGLSLVLGGGEVKLLEHVAAFGVFAREGEKIPITSILKVEDASGKILEENDPELFIPQRAIKPQITRLITNILSDNQSRAFVFGENNYLTLSDRPVAAKTGTTNNFRDAWTIGYTPDLVAGVWVGNSRNEAMADKADGSNVAAPIWQEFMAKSLINTLAKEFTPPEPIIVDKPILKGQMPGEITLEVDKSSGKLATDLTPNSQRIRKTFKKYYPILYYVDKDDPRGPVPENPSLDPQYERWQQGIKDWLEKLREENGDEIKIEIPPTEYDDLHIPANQPSLSIISPQNGTTVGSQILSIKLTAAAPRETSKLICYVDNIPIDSISLENVPNDSLSECFINFAGLDLGEHKIKISVFDDIDNSKSQEVWVITNKTFDQKISWLSLDNNDTVLQKNFPLNLSILTPALKIKMVRFFAQNLTTSQTSLLGTIFNPEASGRINLTWNMADKIEYKLWAEIIDTNNQILVGEEIQIEVK